MKEKLLDLLDTKVKLVVLVKDFHMYTKFVEIAINTIPNNLKVYGNEGICICTIDTYHRYYIKFMKELQRNNLNLKQLDTIIDELVEFKKDTQ
jgi:hypothetical protein